MQRKDVEKYSELYSKLSSMKGDIALLSAKKPNETVNEFKLKLINKLLAQINELIDKFKPEDDFDSFDDYNIKKEKRKKGDTFEMDFIDLD